MSESPSHQIHLDFLPSYIMNPPNQPFYARRATSRSSSSQKFLSSKFQDLKYKEAIEILLIPPNERTHDNVLRLTELTTSMNYFQEMNRKSINQSERVHERCCVVMRYEYFKKGQVIFFADEKPNKFFVIFGGTVNILIPKTESNYKKDLKELMRKNGLKISRNFIETYSQKMNTENEDSSEDQIPLMSPSKMKSEFSRYMELLGGINLTDLQLDQIDGLFEDGVLKYTYYTSLKDGISFGELGLLRGKLRSATVICKEDCHVGVLMAEDYKNILAVIERKKIYNKFEFFKQFLVKGIAYDNLAKLAYAFEKKKFGRNEYVFKEGDSANEVFLIKRGEIQIHKILTVPTQKRYQLSQSLKSYGREMPLLSTSTCKTQILITLLDGEFFGEDEIINELPVIEPFSQRSYSAFVSSPKTSVYCCGIQFFKKYVFERPNLLKKLREKFLMKKEIWEKQLNNCLFQKKNLNYRKKNTFVSLFNEEKTEIDMSLEEKIIPNENIKKSVSDLKKKMSAFMGKDIIIEQKNIKELSKKSEKFINLKKHTKNVRSITNEEEGKCVFEDKIRFIKKKYEEMLKEKQEEGEKKLNLVEDLAENNSKRLNVFLKAKFRNLQKNEVNKSSLKKFNESLIKSLEKIKKNEKMILQSLIPNKLSSSKLELSSIRSHNPIRSRKFKISNSKDSFISQSTKSIDILGTKMLI